MKIQIIGAGIVGLSIARSLLLKGYKNVEVLEKENDIAKHQSSRNSGVMHAGLYYKPGSLKAKLSRDGIVKMKAYCKSNNIQWEECGKIVVATEDNQKDRLTSLFERGGENNLKNIEILNSNEIRRIEPYVNAVAGIHVPEESIVNYKKVANLYSQEIEAYGGTILKNTLVKEFKCDEINNKYSLITNKGKLSEFTKYLNSGFNK